MGRRDRRLQQAVDAARERRLPPAPPADGHGHAAARRAGARVATALTALTVVAGADTRSMSRTRPGTTVHRRQWLALLGLTAAVAALPVAFGHRGLHAGLNVLVPGAGLYGEHTWVGLALTAVAVTVVVAWL